MKTISSPVSVSSKATVQSLASVDAVVLYDTIPAGKRGFTTLARITGVTEDHLVEIRPRPWRLDFMHDQDTFETALHDLRAAHMIILSTSGHAPLSAAFKIWFATILDQRKGDHVAVVALLGMDERSTWAASRDFHFIKQLTSEAELDFFAPSFSDRYATSFEFDREPVIEISAEPVETCIALSDY